LLADLGDEGELALFLWHLSFRIRVGTGLIATVETPHLKSEMWGTRICAARLLGVGNFGTLEGYAHEFPASEDRRHE
jgi:hypothetical protein